ncbi:MAG: hypothetical protein PF795_15800 [Kiritimatiellae bacterium]|nr:hypothetical protein [Kiritimatiellia bacterium]
MAVLLLFGCFPGDSFGQSKDNDPQVDTELIALSLHEPVEGLYYLSGDELKKFRSGITGMGIPMPYKGSNPLRLYLEPPLPPSPQPGVEPPTPPQPIAEVVLPENQGRVFLLMEQREGEPLRIRPFPASFDSVGSGSYRVFNFASIPVSILLHDTTLRLDSRTRGILFNPAWREGRQDLLAVLGIAVEDRMKVVYSRVWGHDPDRRYFVFIFDGDHSSSPLRIRKVYDRQPPPEADND